MQNGTHNNGNGANGNGHKPDAAIITEHDPASSAGLALLWDGLSPAVTNALAQPLDPGLVSQRKGRAGRTFSYIEGHTAIDEANQVFGYGGWGYELLGEVTLREIENVDPKTGEVKRIRAYSVPVRVTVPGAPPRSDVGFHSVAEDTAEGHETACKGAVTDGMKRALRRLRGAFRKRPLRRPVGGERPAQAAAENPSSQGTVRGHGQPRRRHLLAQAAEAARRAGRRAGLRRGAGAGRRQEADQPGPGRPARPGARAPGGAGGPQGERGAGGRVSRTLLNEALHGADSLYRARPRSHSVNQPTERKETTK